MILVDAWAGKWFQSFKESEAMLAINLMSADIIIENFAWADCDHAEAASYVHRWGYPRAFTDRSRPNHAPDMIAAASATP